ncbi:MAG: ornithine carbamoyltransferase [Gammaproteobacteria bacterium]|nr:ornithine carbamoyltransferase [Gammaproteobacteria bacterium]|tara:strand:+ start:6627 stop:7532 length:906 start_codon:yes stop_codon:yes gene_type:complete
MSSTKRNFLSLLDCSPEELSHLVERAKTLKQNRDWEFRPLRGRTAVLILALHSTRTRVAFETGMNQLGGHTIVLNADDTQLGRGEPIEDTARVLSEMVDIAIIRTLNQEDMESLAASASIPVINAMSSQLHPCQLLADVQTFEELRGPIGGRTVAFVGDGYNMCNSYINAARQWGFNLKIASPSGYEPSPEMVASTDNATLVESPREAVEGADLVVTDVWSSMGHEAQAEQRRAIFAPYQVNEALLDHAPEQTLFMHCLPAHRGEEISPKLLEDPRSAVWQEAGNRLHSQKALLEFLLAEQ